MSVFIRVIRSFKVEAELIKIVSISSSHSGVDKKLSQVYLTDDETSDIIPNGILDSA